jgi:hypothetical protein
MGFYKSLEFQGWVFFHFVVKHEKNNINWKPAYYYCLNSKFIVSSQRKTKVYVKLSNDSYDSTHISEETTSIFFISRMLSIKQRANNLETGIR